MRDSIPFDEYTGRCALFSFFFFFFLFFSFLSIASA